MCWSRRKDRNFDLISMSRNENDSSNIIILLLFAMPLLLILIASGLEKDQKKVFA